MSRNSTGQPKQPPPRVVDVVAPTYQPTKEEVEEDARVEATFEEALRRSRSRWWSTTSRSRRSGLTRSLRRFGFPLSRE